MLLRLRSRLLLSAALVIAVPAMAGSALAGDFIVDFPSIDTNGGFTIDGDDSLTITVTGSITPPLGILGVSLAGSNNNTVNNNGLISTTGNSTPGVDVGSNNSIANSGTIRTQGLSAEGIAGGSGNSIVNSGLVSTVGDIAMAIYVDNYNTIANTGTITVTGDRSHAILAENGNSITNSGTIASAGEYGRAIRAGNGNTIRNSGSIYTGDDGSAGIFARDGNTIVNTGSITTKGGSFLVGYYVYAFAEGIRANDGNTITNSGSISTAGEGSAGIKVRDGNIVTNSGSIVTTGNSLNNLYAREFSDGISAGDGNIITHSGSIVTKGDEADGIFIKNGNDVTVSGSITTFGEAAFGIGAELDLYYGNHGEDNNITITRSGSVVTHGEESFGVFLGVYGALDNQGSISTRGDYAPGVVSIFGGSITHGGSIRTSGDYSYGILLGSRNTVVTSGSIFTSGQYAAAINIGGCYCKGDPGNENVVTVSGSVISARSLSIGIYGYDNTLNLNAPAFLGGKLDLGTDTTVNVITGRSHSILWDFSTGTMAGGDPNISGSVPWFYDPATKKLTTFDPTALSASVDALASVSGTVSGLIQGRLAGGGSGAYAPSMMSSFVEEQKSPAQSRLDSAFGEGASSNGGGTYGNPAGWWIAGFASQYDYSGGDTTLDSDIGYAGLAIGVDADVNANLRAGLLAGWGNASMSANSKWADSVDTEQEGFFGSVYARATSGGFFVDAALSGGLFDVTGDRFVNDNLAYLGNSSASSDSSAWWLSPEIAAGLTLAAGNGWTYIPAARLRYAMQSTDGYSESGAGLGNAIVGDQDIAVAEGRLEIAASRQMESVLFTGRLGWLTQWSPSDNEASVTMLGITQTVSADGGDRQAGYLGVDLDVEIAQNLSLEMAGEATFGGDITGGRFSAALVAKF